MFLIFFGARKGKTEKWPLPVACPYCAQTDSLTLQRTPVYFHLFWIPLFKISVDTFALCSHCKRGYERSEFSSEMLEAAQL